MMKKIQASLPVVGGACSPVGPPLLQQVRKTVPGAAEDSLVEDQAPPQILTRSREEPVEARVAVDSLAGTGTVASFRTIPLLSQLSRK